MARTVANTPTALAMVMNNAMPASIACWRSPGGLCEVVGAPVVGDHCGDGGAGSRYGLPSAGEADGL